MRLVEKALDFAYAAHRGQMRKISHIPYMFHPLEVLAILYTLTTDEEVLAAGLLHDTIEDAKINEDEIRAKFGNRVLELVLSETEKRDESKDYAATWNERKEQSICELKNAADIGVKMLWLSDKLSNLRAIWPYYLLEGDKVWLRFNQKDKTRQSWYYHQVLENIQELKATTAYVEFAYLIDKIFA